MNTMLALTLVPAWGKFGRSLLELQVIRQRRVCRINADHCLSSCSLILPSLTWKLILKNKHPLLKNVVGLGQNPVNLGFFFNFTFLWLEQFLNRFLERAQMLVWPGDGLQLLSQHLKCLRMRCPTSARENTGVLPPFPAEISCVGLRTVFYCKFAISLFYAVPKKAYCRSNAFITLVSTICWLPLLHQMVQLGTCLTLPLEDCGTCDG